MSAPDIESLGPRIEVPFPVMTDAGFPHGLRCATCHRQIAEGQPYAERMEGLFDGGDVLNVLTCVYCPPPRQADENKEGNRG